VTPPQISRMFVLRTAHAMGWLELPPTRLRQSTLCRSFNREIHVLYLVQHMRTSSSVVCVYMWWYSQEPTYSGPYPPTFQVPKVNSLVNDTVAPSEPLTDIWRKRVPRTIQALIPKRFFLLQVLIWYFMPAH
jgi:hypothetical protein